MKYLIFFTFIIFNIVVASSPKEWKKFYQDIEAKCNQKIVHYFSIEEVFKIGKIETIIKEGYLIVIFFFKTKNGLNIGCIYNQQTGDVDVNQIV